MTRLLLVPMFCLMLLGAIPAGGVVVPLDLGPGMQPQVAVSQSGAILVTYGRGNTIYFTRSADAGKTFIPPVKVATPPTTPLGMRRGPRVAATTDGVVIAAVSGELGGGKDGDVVTWRSTDGGATWAGSPRLNNIAGAAREGLIGIASDGASHVFVTWLDLRAPGTTIYGCLSADAGRTFGADQLVYRSPDGHVCQCCHPSAAFAPDGGVYVMFRNSLDGNRDLCVAHSSDGKDFDGTAAKLGRGAWKLNACPMDGGGITAGSGRDPVMSVWQRNGQVFLCVPDGEERLLGEGRQPSIADGLIAWTDPASQLMLAWLAHDERPITLGRHAIDPAVAAHGATRACVWEEAGHVFVLAGDAISQLELANDRIAR